MQVTDKEFATIGPIIRSVAQAESKRLFVPSRNSYERSILVYMDILASVNRALFDAGVALPRIYGDIDPTEDILKQMEADGYHPITLCLKQGCL